MAKESSAKTSQGETDSRDGGGGGGEGAPAAAKLKEEMLSTSESPSSAKESGVRGGEDRAMDSEYVE